MIVFLKKLLQVGVDASGRSAIAGHELCRGRWAARFDVGLSSAPSVSASPGGSARRPSWAQLDEQRMVDQNQAQEPTTEGTAVGEQSGGDRKAKIEPAERDERAGKTAAQAAATVP